MGEPELFQTPQGAFIPVVPVYVHGQGFIYNQIRHMMGACIAVCRGLLPEAAICAALTLPRVPPLPLAPPGGLLLTGARWLSKLRTVQNIPSWQDPQAPPQLSQEAALKALERGEDLVRLPKLALLHSEHQSAAEEFFSSHIKPSIARWAQSMSDRGEFQRLLAEQAASGGYVSIAEDGEAAGGNQGDDDDGPYPEEPLAEQQSLPRYDLRLSVPEHHSFSHSLGGWLALLDQQLQTPTAQQQQQLLQARLGAWASQQQPLQRARNLKAVWRRHCTLAASHPQLQRLWNAELFARGLIQFMLPTGSAVPQSASKLMSSVRETGGVGRPPAVAAPPSPAASGVGEANTAIDKQADSWNRELHDLQGFLWFPTLSRAEQLELQLQAQTDAHSLFPHAAESMVAQQSLQQACEAAAISAADSPSGSATPLLGLDPLSQGQARMFVRQQNIPFDILQQALEEAQAPEAPQAPGPRRSAPEWEDISATTRIRAARLEKQQLLSPLVRLADLQKVLPKVSSTHCIYTNTRFTLCSFLCSACEAVWSCRSVVTLGWLSWERRALICLWTPCSCRCWTGVGPCLRPLRSMSRWPLRRDGRPCCGTGPGHST